jgi:hypothetical protein
MDNINEGILKFWLIFEKLLNLHDGLQNTTHKSENWGTRTLKKFHAYWIHAMSVSDVVNFYFHNIWDNSIPWNCRICLACKYLFIWYICSSCRNHNPVWLPLLYSLTFIYSKSDTTGDTCGAGTDCYPSEQTGRLMF